MTASELKERLPLPEIMARCGDGDRAKKSARCPFHEDGKNSFSVWQRDGLWFWKCHAGCGEGDEIHYLQRKFAVDKAGAFAKWRELAGVNSDVATTHKVKPAPPDAKPERDVSADWRSYVAALADDHAAKLATRRGYSPEFVGWLRERELIGLHEGKLAVPVHNDAGAVVAFHVCQHDGSWRFHPSGCRVRPLLIGEPKAADVVFTFESQWDAFAVLDKLAWHKSALPGAAVIVTRGANNGKLVRGLVKRGAVLYAFRQNDREDPDRKCLKWLADVTEAATADGASVKHVATPPEHKDTNDWTRAGATGKDVNAAIEAATDVTRARPVAPVLEFLRPSELRDYRPPEGIVLAGDCHVVRGSVFVIGGAPGVGKSRAAVALAQAGAICADWFGLKVHVRFRTMIVQNENGRFRLQREFADLDCPALEDFVRVCPPPPLGLAFDRVEFQAALTAAIADFRPDVIVVDPWNAVTRDEKAKDYLETFNAIRAVIPTGDNAPALGIVAHTRKPKSDERTTGRGLLNLLAGSYVLGSVPRTVFVLQSASDDPTEDRVVWTCCKNNDGALGERTAWERRNGLFAPVADFDWTEFDPPANDRPTVTKADVAEVFQHGRRSVRKAEAVAELQERTGAGKSACYNALKLDGRFARHLAESEGLLTWTP